MGAGMTRRAFLGGAAHQAAALGAGLAFSGSVFAVEAGAGRRARRVGPNDRIVLGLIGCGGMGGVNMRALMNKPDIDVAAVCDVDEARMPGDIKAVEEKYGRPPKVYRDYRRMLENKDINAVIIGTPDHWHALNLIHACEAGMDVYCEKPISHNIVEANAMVAAARRFGRVVQVGTWQRSAREFLSAVNYIRSGKLGRIVLVRAWKTDYARMGRRPAATPPAGFDYDMWIGPAARVPYVPEYTHGNWRWFLNFGCGMTGDWGVHMMDIGLLAMSRSNDLVMPVEVSAYGGKLAWPDDARTAPDTHIAIMRFRNPDFVLHWETGRDYPGRPDHGTEFVSEDGRTLTVWRGGWRIRSADGKELPREEVPGVSDHWQDWVDCIRSRQQPRSDLASMAQTTIVCHLANAALLAGAPVRWDKARMDIVGSTGKNTLAYQREYRKPWKLPVYRV